MRKPSQHLLENLAKNVRVYRLKNVLSQEQLAEQCGFHRTYIGSIERGERNVTLSTLEILSEALNVSITQLLNSNGELTK
ncbi:MAG: helix-turn-helix transcriptional regulator [Legionella sp.]|nr:helix-turn-helix transcriptional regulator [Legionella sp.]